MRHQALQLYDDHVWTNGRLFGHHKTLPEVACQQLVERVFPSVHEALVHIYTADQV